ncbi:MAG: chemotaxis protein CheX [bacterium]|nr:chemotaxis protein CheX [bacterium]
MQTSVQDQLCRTFNGIVEKLTFMFGEVATKEEIDSPGTLFTLASMKFAGDMAGELSVAVPSEITAEIAANILGLEPEDIESETMMNDALAEMLNVVCGHVIMDMKGTDANFKLASPETTYVDDEKYREMMASDDYAGLMLDDNPVFLGLKLES